MSLFLDTLDTIYYTIVSMTTRYLRAIARSFVQQDTESHESVSDTVPEPAIEKTTFKTVEQIFKSQTVVGEMATKNTIMYAGTVAVPVFKNPTVEFDTQIASIPYGEIVMVFEPKGRFFRVAWGEYEGWVLRDDLADRAMRVYPEFFIGHENLVDHPNTAHVRSILGDVFGLSRSEFPLQAGEYVLYRLWKKGIRVTWPEIRPRVPGLWHTILKGNQKVHVSVTPRVGAIMEYMFNTDIGHLAYVEAVFPDEMIAVSEANYPDSGVYNERELTKAEWKELRPVFITIIQ